MIRFDPITVDNFFTEPSLYRKFALSQKWYASGEGPNNANHPGYRTDYLSVLDEQLFQKFSFKLYDALNIIDRDTPSYIESFFQYCREEDGNSWVHRDSLYFNPTHVGVVYLTPNPPQNSGTILYHPPYTPYNYDTDLYEESGNPEDYEVKVNLENRYNRMVMYDPNEFHKSDTYFGDNIKNSRLFIVFFMRLGK